MQWELHPYTIALVVSSAISAILAVAAWKKRSSSGSISFIIMMFSLSAWSMVHIFELKGADVQTKSCFANIQFFFIVTVPVVWLMFVMYYTRRLNMLTRQNISKLAIIPFLTVFLVWTNPLHHLVFTKAELISSPPFLLLYRHFGPWFWIHTAYSYLLMLAGAFLLVRSFLITPQLFKGQTLFLLVGLLAPWLGNIIYIFKISPWWNLDMTPFAFTISGAAFGWSIFKYRLLNIVPIAYSLMLNNMRDAVFVFDVKNRLLDLTPSAMQFAGLDRKQMMGTDAERIIPGWVSIVAGLEEAGKVSKQISFDDEARGKTYFDITVTPLLKKGYLLGRLAVMRDITEERSLEAQLLQSQKMEAIGTLAGGVAHDFNNLLMGILANTTLVRLGLDKDHPGQKRLDRIEKQVQTGASLTRQLLGYARKGKYRVEPLDLNETVQIALKTFGRTKKHLKIHFNPYPKPPIIEADQGQIELVLLNLFVNAADAMPDGGTLYVDISSSNNVSLNDKAPKVKPGTYVKLSVSDTGTGMDYNTKSRIFEPFFTTKELGRGTGLGLASVYGVVKNHNGYIDVRSALGQGSCFDLYFPASKADVKNLQKTGNVSIKGSGRILYVDDEIEILEAGSELIESLGYDVIPASNGEDAVALFSDYKNQIQLVILDMVMPKMDGIQVFNNITQIKDSVKFLISSGYSMNEKTKYILSKGDHDFIKKPFTRKLLSEKISAMMA